MAPVLQSRVSCQVAYWRSSPITPERPRLRFSSGSRITDDETSAAAKVADETRDRAGNTRGRRSFHHCRGLHRAIGDAPVDILAGGTTERPPAPAVALHLLSQERGTTAPGGVAADWRSAAWRRLCDVPRWPTS